MYYQKIKNTKLKLHALISFVDCIFCVVLELILRVIKGYPANMSKNERAEDIDTFRRLSFAQQCVVIVYVY